jgi:hypothetical protein
MTGLVVALRQIRGDVISISSLIARIWDARKSLSPRAQSFYLLGLIGLPIFSLVYLPAIFFFPFLFFLLIIYDGFAVMVSTTGSNARVQDAEWRRV